jgi:predicted dehydrogenase
MTVPTPAPSRREFLKAGTVASLAGGLLAGSQALAPKVHAAEGDSILKVGLIGCGGRGTGAANQALHADPRVQLFAVGDAFADCIPPSLNALKSQAKIADRVVVDAEHQFVGLDAYQKVIDTCDVVLLASPPGFRPEHLAYAVEKGKHMFVEKPVATDAPGIRSAMESVRIAKEKKLALVAGFCWRYDSAKRAFFERVLAGELGTPQCTYSNYLTGPVKQLTNSQKRPQDMSEFEWQVRNWYNFTWLSGDGLVEQACHAVDWIAWSKGDVPPVSCTAVGGRQIPPLGGDLFDHIEVNYLYADGTRAFIAQRQIPGCFNENNCYVLGTKGQGEVTRRGVSTIAGDKKWRYEGPTPNMYQVEHDEMFKSIRDGNPINNGDRLITSTLTAIMGRMAGYSGKEITWEQALNSTESLVPKIQGWDTPVEVRSAPLPGVYKSV